MLHSIQGQRNRDKALVLAHYYFELLATEAGIHWDSDNRAEVDEMVNYIITAAIEEVKAEVLAALPGEIAKAMQGAEIVAMVEIDNKNLSEKFGHLVNIDDF